MKTWTKYQVVTHSILFALLILYFSNSLLGLIYNSLLSPAIRDAYSDKIEFWGILLYGLIYFASFPVIAVVIKLNQDQLQKLNIDKFYVLLLITAGLFVLYSLPYNCFVGIAVIYAVYILFDTKTRFGIVDDRALRMILLIVGVFAGIMICIISFADTGVDLLKSEQWSRKFWLETIPISIYEEVVFRGMLYMFLKDLGLNESRTFYIQALVFWISHINYLFQSPSFFWIILPIGSLIFGYLVYRSKSITPSTIAHILYNALAGFSRLTW